MEITERVTDTVFNLFNKANDFLTNPYIIGFIFFLLIMYEFVHYFNK